MMIRPLRRLPLLAMPAVALALSGCISFGAKPPESLLTLSSTAQIEPGRTVVARADDVVTVMIPMVPQEIAVQRVPVRTAHGTLAYVKDAQWVEPPSRLFQRLLSETIEARTGRTVLSPRQFDMDPGTRLNGQLSSFGIDAGTSQAVVIYDATLLGGPGGSPDAVRTRRFEARVPVTAIETGPVGTALNEAANQVAAQVADWIRAPGE